MAIKKPLIGITMGDAAGIGPEIILKTLQDASILRTARFLILGDKLAFSAAAKKIKCPDASQSTMTFPVIHDLTTIPIAPVVFYDCNYFKKPPVFGKTNKLCGEAAVHSIETAVQLAMQRQISAIVTAPLNKEILKLSGSSFHGHTEMLAELTNTDDFGMAFVGGGLRLILTTIHEPINKVPKLLTIAKVLGSIRLAARACKELGIDKPKIGVAGLNPHAGENGMFGNEEIKIISPAIRKARQSKIDVIGPIPPDTLFHRTLQGEFDFLVCMYHDQALIPLKTLDFYGGVNLTIGLPIIRTSPDHGTAYNLAGKGIANPDSMKAAVNLAIQIAHHRNLV